MKLSPGQVAVDGFPRFGTHLHLPPPPVPASPEIGISGAIDAPFAIPLPLTKLATLPRRELTADFHCVAGWSATNLQWEGVSFETFYRTVLEPEVKAGASITHVVFGGLDGYQSVALLEDALADDVLIAENLNGLPLDGDHGAPARLVSPSQYGFVNTKHLCRIELHTKEPPADFGGPSLMARAALWSRLIWRHPRARVWQEERHPFLPAWFMRPAYRIFIPQIRYLSARGSRPLKRPGDRNRLPRSHLDRPNELLGENHMDAPTKLRARQIPVAHDDEIPDGEQSDYADAFEIQLLESDSRSPEEFARCALEEAPQPLRSVIRTTHKYILRLGLGPDESADHVFGWKVHASRPDLLHLEAASPLLGRAVLLGRRVSPTRSTITTYLYFSRPAPARALWTLAGPLHRRVALILLEHAAASASQRGHAATVDG